jgi:hypothetical protein
MSSNHFSSLFCITDYYVNTNIVENSVKNNTKSFDRIQCNTEQYRNSFFNKTILERNHLEENIVNANRNKKQLYLNEYVEDTNTDFNSTGERAPIDGVGEQI